MSKFDNLYNDLSYSLLNEVKYIDSTFEDNIRLLLKILLDKDYLPQDTDIDEMYDEVINQHKNNKEIILDTKEKSIPAIKILVGQESGPESFTVTVINLEKPEEQKKFTNTMMETIFRDVISYVESIALKGIQPNSAIENLPPEEGATAQPGSGESALPGNLET